MKSTENKNFYRLMQKQNYTWSLMDNGLLQDDDVKSKIKNKNKNKYIKIKKN